MQPIVSHSPLQEPPHRAWLVSVVVPTYNRAVPLRQAITSALRQTWTDLEVVVVDDGSTDDTPAVVADMARCDGRVRYLRRPNGGVAAARNTALSKCRGGLIAFLDSDDAWQPWKLRSQVAVLKALPQVGMVWTDMHAVGPDGRLLGENYLKTFYHGYRKLGAGPLFAHGAPLHTLMADVEPALRDAGVSWGYIYPQMLHGNLAHTSTVVLRREKAAQVGAFDESMIAGEDYKFHLHTTRLGEVAFLDLPSIHYRIGAADQLTSPRYQVPIADAFLRTVEEEFSGRAPEMTLGRAAVAGIRADAHAWLAEALLDAGERRRAATHALLALRQRPLLPKAGRTLVKTVLPPQAMTLLRAARRAAR
jgi:hypothetical protein